MQDMVEVTVGGIGRAHGLGGEVFIDLRTDEPVRRFTVRRAAARSGTRGAASRSPRCGGTGDG